MKILICPFFTVNESVNYWKNYKHSAICKHGNCMNDQVGVIMTHPVVRNGGVWIHLWCLKSKASPPADEARHWKHPRDSSLRMQTFSDSDTMSVWSASQEIFNRHQGHLYRHACVSPCTYNIAVWSGTAIMPCCLFDMQRSAVEQLHGRC